MFQWFLILICLNFIFQLNTIPVLKVFLKGDKGVHFTQVPIDAGTEVNIQLDWQRRFDHMQQHSGMFVASYNVLANCPRSRLLCSHLLNHNLFHIFGWECCGIVCDPSWGRESSCSVGRK